MNELELIRAQLLGIQAQAEAAIRQVSALIEKMAEPEPEPRISWLGQDDEPAA